RELKQTLIVEAFVKVVEPLQLQVVTNVTGPNIVVERRLLKVEQVVAEETEREVIESDITLPMQALKIFTIMAKIEDVETKVKRDKVIIRGTLHKQIFFVDMGNLLRHHAENIPFSIVLDTPGAEEDMTVHERVRIVGDVDFTLKGVPSSTTTGSTCPTPTAPVQQQPCGSVVHQAVVVEAFAKVTEEVQLNVVVDVRETGAPPPPPAAECPSMRFHVVQPGESLWSIAQRYGVTLEALLAANPTLKQPEMVYPGQKICIPPRVIGQG
ncbi:MAG TPA: LysM peptidoglycan-binding domain-containing protein, partial [Firmicutes bacterium]|nr:LysM peptidoglycan-binding domain-containing protein [Bacillota bacterium]